MARWAHEGHVVQSVEGTRLGIMWDDLSCAVEWDLEEMNGDECLNVEISPGWWVALDQDTVLPEPGG